MSARFHKDDILVIDPVDTDDPIAQSRMGEPCRFLRYGATGLAVVEMEDRKVLYFRPQDLTAKQAFLTEAE